MREPATVLEQLVQRVRRVGPPRGTALVGQPLSTPQCHLQSTHKPCPNVAKLGTKDIWTQCWHAQKLRRRLHTIVKAARSRLVHT